MNKLVVVYDSEKDTEELPNYCHPNDLIKFIDNKLNLIPKEYRDSAEVSISSYTYSDISTVELAIYYYRPKNQEDVQEERQKRIKQVQDAINSYKERIKELEKSLKEDYY